MVTVDLSEADEGATLAAMTALPPPTRSQTAQVASLLNLMRAEQDNRRRAQTAAAELQAEVEELRRENSRVAHALQERTAQQKESERNARMQTVLYRQREQEQTATCEDLARRLQQSTEGPAPRPPFSEAESTSTSELFRVLTQSASDWEQVSRYESQQPFFSGATTPDASPAEVTEVHPSASQSRSHRSSTSRQSMSSAVEANEDGHPHAASWATPRLASEASHDSRPSSAGLLSQLTGMSFFREVGVLPEGSEPAGGQEAKELPTVAEPAETSQELIQNEVPLFGLSLARLEDMNPAVAVEPEAAAQEEVEVSAAPEPLQAVSVEVAEEEIGSPAAFELAPAESEEGNFLTPAKIEEVAQEDVEVPDPLEPAQGVSDEATEETGLPAASQLPEAGSEDAQDMPSLPGQAYEPAEPEPPRLPVKRTPYTNAGATRREVSNFASSLTTSIFRDAKQGRRGGYPGNSRSPSPMPVAEGLQGPQHGLGEPSGSAATLKAPVRTTTNETPPFAATAPAGSIPKPKLTALPAGEGEGEGF